MSRIFYLVLVLGLAILIKEAQCHRTRNFWVVYDYQNKLDKERHRRPSSCILAGFEAKIHVMDQEIAVPQNATATNHTCTLSADNDLNQKLVVTWGASSSLTLYFVQDNGTDPFNSLDKVELSGSFNNSNNEAFSVQASSQSELDMMRAPQLFAFVCHHPLNISLEGTVSEISSGTLVGNDTGVDSGKKENITLVLSSVRVEPFRRERHYDDFTHLKYDCVKGWPYGWVDASIGLALLVASLGFFVAFFLRCRKRSKRYANLKEESECPQD